MIVHIRFLAKLWIPLWLLLIWKQTVMMSLAQTVQVETSPFAKTDGTAPTVDTTSKMLSTETPGNCTPVISVNCIWSDWYDVDFPSTDPDDGDHETYDNIRSAGFNICEKPQAIKCRSELFSDTPIDQLSQKVTCDLNYGLICNNRDQVGQTNYCLNFQIQVLCCEEHTTCMPMESTTTSILTTTTIEGVKSPPQSLATESSTISSTSTPESVTSPAQSPTTEWSTISSTSTTESVTSSAQSQTPPVFTTTSQTPTESSTPTVPSSPSATPEQHDFCLSNGITYKVGATVPELKHCQDCKCTDDTDPVTGTKIILCEPVVCQEETCQSGFTYERSDKECCGTCKQISCVLNDTEEKVLIMPGQSWYPPGDKCTYYECDENNFTLTKKIISCPKQKIRKCKKGALIEVESADKCCKRKVCTTGTRECNVKIQKKIIRLGDCSALVPLPYCKGSCNKSSRSSSSEERKYKCSRCEAKKSQVRKIKLACENGRSESYTYSHVEECQCKACTPSN